MDLALRIGAAAGVGGERLPEHRLACLFIAVPRKLLINLNTGCLLALNEFDHRGIRYDPGRITPEAVNCLHERPFVILRSTHAVLPDPKRHAEDLRECNPVLHIIILEQVHPRDDPQDAVPARVPRLCLVAVDDKLIFRKRDPGREFPCAYLHLIGPAVPDQLLGMHIHKILDHVPTVRPDAPRNLQHADAFADRVEHINKNFIQVLNTLQLRVNKRRHFLALLIIPERLHLPIKPRHGQLPCLELRKQVRVFLFHLLKQLHLLPHIAVVCRPENPCELLRRQPVGRVSGIFVIRVTGRHPCMDRPHLPAVCFRVKRLFLPLLFLCQCCTPPLICPFSKAHPPPGHAPVIDAGADPLQGLRKLYRHLQTVRCIVILSHGELLKLL